jgi:hypothetical protein
LVEDIGLVHDKSSLGGEGAVPERGQGGSINRVMRGMAENAHPDFVIGYAVGTFTAAGGEVMRRIDYSAPGMGDAWGTGQQCGDQCRDSEV